MGDLISLAESLAEMKQRQMTALATNGLTTVTKTSELAFNCDLCHDHGGFGEIGAIYHGLIWRQFCTCEEGQRQERAHQERLAEWEREQTESRIARVFAWADDPAMFRGWTLETYPKDGDTAALVVCRRYIEERDSDKYSLLLLGPGGRGKTGLAIGVIRALITKGETCLFMQTGIYLNKLRDAFSIQRDPKRLEAMEGIGWASAEQIREIAQNVPVLGLDDFGDPDRRSAISDWEREETFNLINNRYVHKLPTVITTNLREPQIVGQYGDRTMQRIKHMCETIRVTGRNLREKRS